MPPGTLCARNVLLHPFCLGRTALMSGLQPEVFDEPGQPGPARRLRRGDDRLDREVEWDAEDVGILGVEESSSLRS
jgi:hypothetical protein